MLRYFGNKVDKKTGDEPNINIKAFMNLYLTFDYYMLVLKNFIIFGTCKV
jgi:hypothetical protein